MRVYSHKRMRFCSSFVTKFFGKSYCLMYPKLYDSSSEKRRIKQMGYIENEQSLNDKCQ